MNPGNQGKPSWDGFCLSPWCIRRRHPGIETRSHRTTMSPPLFGWTATPHITCGALPLSGAVPCRAFPCLALPCLSLPCLALPCLALPCLALRATVRRAAKQARIFTQMQKGWTPMHADGPESGMLLHCQIRPTLMTSADALVHVRSACIHVHLLRICVRFFLAYADACRTLPQGSPAPTRRSEPRAPCAAGRDGGPGPPRGYCAAVTPRAQRRTQRHTQPHGATIQPAPAAPSRVCGSFHPSTFPATKLRSTCAVPPPMVNMRASRAIRSIGYARE